jgi:hypothetical protein
LARKGDCFDGFDLGDAGVGAAIHREQLERLGLAWPQDLGAQLDIVDTNASLNDVDDLAASVRNQT